MPYLQRFNIINPHNYAPDVVASLVYQQLGLDDCAYHYDDVWISYKSMKEFYSRVKQMRVDDRKK